MKRVQRWLTRVFFAATVGFVVPARDFWQSRSLALGAALAVAVVAAKLTSGLCAQPQQGQMLVVGLAMACLGECTPTGAGFVYYYCYISTHDEI